MCSEIVRSVAPASITPRQARPRVVRLETPFNIDANVALPLAVATRWWNSSSNCTISSVRRSSAPSKRSPAPARRGNSSASMPAPMRSRRSSPVPNWHQSPSSLRRWARWSTGRSRRHHRQQDGQSEHRHGHSDGHQGQCRRLRRLIPTGTGRDVHVCRSRHDHPSATTDMNPPTPNKGQR